MLPAKADTTATATKEETPEATSAEVSATEATEAAEWGGSSVANETQDTAVSEEETPQAPDETEAPEEGAIDTNWEEELGASPEPETSKESDEGGEPAPEVAEETVTETPVEVDVTNIDPHLLSGARELGLSDEETGKLNQVGLLETTMGRILDESRASLGRTPAAETPEKAPDKIELDPEIYDEETIGKVEAQNALVEKQNETINALREEKAQTATQSAQQEFNKFISGLGDEWEPVFGKGHVEEGSPAYVNRLRLLDASEEQGLGMQAKGKNTDLPAVFNQGLRMAFPEHETKLATDKLSAQVTARSKQILSKPGNTKKVALTPTQAAEATVARIAKERGIDLGPDTDAHDDWSG